MGLEDDDHFPIGGQVLGPLAVRSECRCRLFWTDALSIEKHFMPNFFKSACILVGFAPLKTKMTNWKIPMSNRNISFSRANTSSSMVDFSIVMILSCEFSAV